VLAGISRLRRTASTLNHQRHPVDPAVAELTATSDLTRYA
jgi:hypothetical protein